MIFQERAPRVPGTYQHYHNKTADQAYIAIYIVLHHYYVLIFTINRIQ